MYIHKFHEPKKIIMKVFSEVLKKEVLWNYLERNGKVNVVAQEAPATIHGFVDENPSSEITWDVVMIYLDWQAGSEWVHGKYKDLIIPICKWSDMEKAA